MDKKNSKYYLDSSGFLGWGENSVLDKERLRLIDEYVSNGNILDIGCGFGLYVDYLASRGLSATGVDFVSEFINHAKKKRRGNFLKAKIEKLPFAENEFDTSILFDVLEHGDDIKILMEAKRVSKKRIIVIVPRKIDSQLEKSGVIFRHYLDKSHKREYTDGDLERLGKIIKLKLVCIKKIHPVNNESVFLFLFKGPVFLKKIIRKIVFLLLPGASYPTEFFAVFEK